MEIIDRDTFFEITSTFDIVPYTQARGMYEFYALSGADRIIFFVNSKENPSLACFGHEKRMLKKTLILIEGECYAKKADLESRKQVHKYVATIQAFYSELKKAGYDIIEIQSDSEWNFHYETALRLAGFLRPVGVFSLASTRIIDLQKPVGYDRNWERNLKKSAEHHLQFEVFSQSGESDCSNFCTIYNAMSHRKGLNHRLSVSQVFNMCSDSRFKLFVVNQAGRYVAGIIAYVDEKAKRGTGIFAGSTKEALTTSATFFMYDNMFNYLRNRGCTSYDMAKLLPAADGQHAVFQFKNGIDGISIPLNGDFSWHKKQYYRLLMYLMKKYLLKKREM